MTRATRLLAATTVVGLAAVDLALPRQPIACASAARSKRPAKTAGCHRRGSDRHARSGDPWIDAEQAALGDDPPRSPTAILPALPEETEESRGSSDARAAPRSSPRCSAVSTVRPRRSTEARIGAADHRRASRSRGCARWRTAGSPRRRPSVTPEQSAKLDQAFDKVYADVLDYTNKAITDGMLSPYERNVAGWLDYAGGLGGMLDEAQGSIGKILDARADEDDVGVGLRVGRVPRPPGAVGGPQGPAAAEAEQLAKTCTCHVPRARPRTRSGCVVARPASAVR